MINTQTPSTTQEKKKQKQKNEKKNKSKLLSFHLCKMNSVTYSSKTLGLDFLIYIHTHTRADTVNTKYIYIYSFNVINKQTNKKHNLLVAFSYENIYETIC